MPELPEVETVVKTLRPILLGSSLVSISTDYEKLFHPSFKAFEKELKGQTFKKIDRIGKFIVFFFDRGSVVVSHLRMEGKFIELKDKLSPLSRFCHVVFTLNDGRRLIYDDMRKFGTFTLTNSKDYLQLAALKYLGQEPLNDIDPKVIYQKIHRSIRPIKSILLDQTILLGLGNIYADEVLYASRIHPLTKGRDLSLNEIQDILSHSKRILLEAIASGGSRIRSYQSGHPIDGTFTLKIKAYGKDGEACERCHHRLDKITVGGRGTHYCPRCQHHPDLPFVIGVTGTIATGKSALLNVGKTLGFLTISADDIVGEIYKTKPAISKIRDLFPHAIIRHQIDRTLLLGSLVTHGQNYHRLMVWLFPLVKDRIFTALTRTKTKVVLIEVPLLFQSNLDAYCDVIIGVDMNASLQKERLVKRQKNHADQLWLLNERNHYLDYVHWIDHRLSNDGTVEAWEKKSEAILKPYLKYL